MKNKSRNSGKNHHEVQSDRRHRLLRGSEKTSRRKTITKKICYKHTHSTRLLCLSVHFEFESARHDVLLHTPLPTPPPPSNTPPTYRNLVSEKKKIKHPRLFRRVLLSTVPAPRALPYGRGRCPAHCFGKERQGHVPPQLSVNDVIRFFSNSYSVKGIPQLSFNDSIHFFPDTAIFLPIRFPPNPISHSPHEGNNKIHLSKSLSSTGHVFQNITPPRIQEPRTKHAKFSTNPTFTKK